MLNLATMTVGVVSLATPYFDLELAQRNLDATREVIGARYRMVGPANVIVGSDGADEAIAELENGDVDVLLIQIGTFPDGELPARLAMSVKAPIVVHGIPEPAPRTTIALNSLCGVNATTFTLSALNHPHAYVLCQPDDTRLVTTVDSALTAAALNGARIGVYGSHPQGFYPSAYDELGLLRKLGLIVEHVSMHELYPESGTGERKSAPTPPRKQDGSPLDTSIVTDLEVRYAAAAKSLASRPHLDAVTIKDWPELWGMWPVLGWLQDDGHLIAVEGDLHAALTMVIQHGFSHGGTQMLADISAVDNENSTLTLWHYGAATALSADPNDVTHDAEGQIVQFPLRPGRATLARIGGHQGGYRILTIDVEISEEQLHIQRAAGLAKTLRTPAGTVVDTMLDDGWDHHVILCYGDWTDHWRYLAKVLDIPLVAL